MGGMVHRRTAIIGCALLGVIGIPVTAGALCSFTGLMLSSVLASMGMAFGSVHVVMNSLRLRHVWVT